MKLFAFKSTVLMLSAALALAACGKRGPLEAPPGATPSTNPAVTGNPGNENAPVSPAELSGQNAANPGSGNQSTAKPKRPFPLDPLL
ncbi:MAG: lipoprotein [Alphaproteobacteria bacterium]|nr:lipoprotein [Alphaproteobacteria bacterium]MCL2453135.1 lipoprotein [Alphaproteobacteria bacterium]